MALYGLHRCSLTDLHKHLNPTIPLGVLLFAPEAQLKPKGFFVKALKLRKKRPEEIRPAEMVTF